MSNADRLTSAVTSVTYSSFASDIDLVAAKKAPCRRIRINSAGSGALALTYPNGDTDTITGLNGGDVIDVQATKILTSGTSISGATVFW